MGEYCDKHSWNNFLHKYWILLAKINFVSLLQGFIPCPNVLTALATAALMIFLGTEIFRSSWTLLRFTLLMKSVQEIQIDLPMCYLWFEKFPVVLIFKDYKIFPPRSVSLCQLSIHDMNLLFRPVLLPQTEWIMWFPPFSYHLYTKVIQKSSYKNLVRKS